MPKATAENSSQSPTDLHPRLSVRCLGQNEGERQLVQAYGGGRLPHAWLFTGPKGIGKATLAYRFARFLLAGDARTEPGTLNTDAQNAAVRRINQGSHADLMVVETGERDTIPAEEIRALSGFLSHTPAEGKWRMVIIDAAENMNMHAANSLLKMLEEPPARAVLVLISHNPGALLPTIRSRCRVLKLRPQNDESFKAIIQSHSHGHEGEEQAYFQLADGSPGVALFLMEQEALALYQAMLELFAPPTQTPDWMRAHAIAGQLASKQDVAYFHAFTHIMHYWFSQLVKVAELGPSGARAEILPGENATLCHMASFRSAPAWLELWQQAARLFDDVARIHLDRRQVVLNIMAAMQQNGCRLDAGSL